MSDSAIKTLARYSSNESGLPVFVLVIACCKSGLVFILVVGAVVVSDSIIFFFLFSRSSFFFSSVFLSVTLGNEEKQIML